MLKRLAMGLGDYSLLAVLILPKMGNWEGDHILGNLRLLRFLLKL
jgi:hypothetical protein